MDSKVGRLLGSVVALTFSLAVAAQDTGLVVDSFGVVGLQPMEYWGDQQYMTRDNTLRRKPEVYRGDALILDPFDPATEFEAYGDHNFDSIHKHVLRSDSTPTDLVISQLDFAANETLVVRRLGGEMALSCRAQSHSYVMNYPAIPIIRLAERFTRRPPSRAEAASPN